MMQLIEDNYEQILGHCVKDNASPIDLTNAGFIDPYGMVSLLEIGEFLKLQGIRKTIYLPDSEEVLKYLERMDFFRFAEDYFYLEWGLSQIYGPKAVESGLSPLSEKYHFNSLNKNVVKIAVMDLGIGFRKSLSERFSIKDDYQAIEKALLHGASRYTDEGRGHGLAAVKRFVSQWNGKLSIRSGTARLSIIPSWAWGKEKEINLAHFPGSQIGIMLPEI